MILTAALEVAKLEAQFRETFRGVLDDGARRRPSGRERERNAAVGLCVVRPLIPIEIDPAGVPLRPPVFDAPLVAALIKSVRRAWAGSFFGGVLAPLRGKPVEFPKFFRVGNESVEVEQRLLAGYLSKKLLQDVLGSFYRQITFAPIRHRPL